MIWAHAHLGGQITEHMILLMIFSTHAFSYHDRLWICSIFPHPVSRLRHTAGNSRLHRKWEWSNGSLPPVTLVTVFPVCAFENSPEAHSYADTDACSHRPGRFRHHRFSAGRRRN